jgi:hypothetical protein
MLRAIQHICARWYKRPTVARETGVEGKADMVCLLDQPRGRESFGVSHPAYDIRTTKRVWTAVHTCSSFATNEQTDLSRNALGDVIVFDIKSRGEKITRIIII